MSGRNAPVWGDAKTLELMDLRAEGLTAAAAADRLGVTRSAVLGLELRMRAEMALAEAVTGAHPAVKPKNLDGGMPRRWWAAGLARQMNLARGVAARGGRP